MPCLRFLQANHIKVQPKKKKEKPLAFDYSKWDSLEREMRADEEEENNTRVREANAAVRRQEMPMEPNQTWSIWM